MNIQKFTQKSMQAVEGCEKLAYEYGNQEIEQEHLLYSLLTIEDSLILKLVEKMGIQKEHFVSRAEQALERAQEQLRQKQSIQEYHVSQASLARAMLRLKEAGKYKLK